MKRRFYEEPSFEYIRLDVEQRLLNESDSGETPLPDAGDDAGDDFF